MSLRFKRLAVVALTLIVSGASLTASLAADRRGRPPMDPRGEPAGLKRGITECYKVWHNSDGWHVRVVNGKGSRDHRYQGSITVQNGVMEHVRSHLAKTNGLEAQWKHGPRKHEVTFDFATPQKEDGINFKASRGATTIRFTLKIDGRDVPEQIFIGKRGDHPDSSTFSVAAHPGN